jgi:chemotaxis protein MotB
MIFAGGTGVMHQDGNSAISMEESGVSDNKAEEDKMTEVKKMIEEEIKKEGYSDKVKVDLNSEGLAISIQDVVLFNSGEADVLKDVSQLLLKISHMLYGLDNEIKVAGYTDNVPINNGKFRSN